jgi:SAM-dependent methyltransferase
MASEGFHGPKATLRCPCEGAHCRTRFEYREPPPGEVRFDLGNPDAYRRELRECGACGHFFSAHEIAMDRLYTGGYVDANYGTKGIGEQFARINALDPARSDNVGRVERVHAYASKRLDEAGVPAAPRTVLDIGSGLCVFLHRMKQRGWDCTALDPDPRTAGHARDTVGINAYCGDFFAAGDLGRFHLVTFNKVLEHVTDPVAMLAKSRRHLLEGGLVYIELPDGPAAARVGGDREEFFIDHWHAFSPVSIAMLAERSGFDLLLSERLVEPSGKYTLRAFLTLAQA